MKKALAAFTLVLSLGAFYAYHQYTTPPQVTYISCDYREHAPAVLNTEELNVLKQMAFRHHKDCQFTESGSIKHLYCDGQKVSGGYHHHYFLNDGVVYGGLGSRMEPIVYENGTIAKLGGADLIDQQEKDNEQAVLDQLGGNSEWSIQHAGAIQHLSHGRMIMSKGYHRFYLHDGKIWGKLGAFEEPVRIRPYFWQQVAMH